MQFISINFSSKVLINNCNFLSYKLLINKVISCQSHLNETKYDNL